MISLILILITLTLFSGILVFLGQFVKYFILMVFGGVFEKFSSQMKAVTVIVNIFLKNTQTFK